MSRYVSPSERTRRKAQFSESLDRKVDAIADALGLVKEPDDPAAQMRAALEEIPPGLHKAMFSGRLN
jgi:hypothetical protein